ncbi:MAG TPA: dual specificity protein phosphatase [Anaerolineales bacterium]|jgi:dual specificity MAP kinase phosphatase|nr:dual specificity protein phosphatase [Anaerolineales bacterium]
MFEFSNITDNLFIGITPLVADYNGLRELGIKLIINMRLMHGPYPDEHPEPIKLLWLRTFDSPFFPIPISKLMTGAKAALETVEAGGKVYVHCAGGRHRGVAMGSCILIAQGYEPEAAMRLISERRLVADPNIPYIRAQIMKFARQWKNT